MRKTWARRMGAILVAGLLALPARAETLRFRLGEDPETLYNVKSFSLTVAQVLGSYLLESLVYFDARGQVQPWLASGWQISPDQKQITFKLRDGVKFHDGTAFDAAAVKFHFDQVMDRKNASPLLPLIGSLSVVEVLDPLTVKFTFEKPYAPFFSNIAQASFGFNSPTAVAKFGAQYGRNVVGTGPFMLKSWVPGTELTLVRNPAYHQFREDASNKGPALADTVVLSVISEDAVALAALETGELTAAGVATDVIAKLSTNPKFSVILKKIVNNLLFLEFNEKHPPFDDPEFRRAIGYAIDRDAAVKAAYAGYAKSELGSMASGIPFYDPAAAAEGGTPFDPAKARALFARLGWTPGPDGTLAKDGKPAKFVLKSYAGFETIDRTLAVVQSNLADLGIQVSLETADWGTFYPGLLKGDWDMDLMRWTSGDPNILGVLFRSPGHRKLTLPVAELDATLDRCDTLMDPGERAGCVSTAQKLLLRNASIVPILSNWLVIAAQASVKGYDLDFFNYLLAGDVTTAK